MLENRENEVEKHLKKSGYSGYDWVMLLRNLLK